MRYTLQTFSRGCKNDDLKNLTDFPNEVLSHSGNKKTYNTVNRTGKKIPNGISDEGSKHCIGIPLSISALKLPMLISSKSCKFNKNQMGCHEIQETNSTNCIKLKVFILNISSRKSDKVQVLFFSPMTPQNHGVLELFLVDPKVFEL